MGIIQTEKTTGNTRLYHEKTIDSFPCEMGPNNNLTYDFEAVSFVIQECR